MPIPILSAVLRTLGWGARASVAQAVTNAKSPAKAAGVNAITQKPHDSFLTKLWTIESLANLKTRVLDGYSPEFQHTIFVAVRGGPKADINRIWRLALAAAFGKYRNAVPSYQGAQIEATWDITEKIVGVKISYAISGAIANLALGQGTSGLEYLYRGPSQETVGGTWPDWLRSTREGLEKLVGVPGPVTRVIGGLLFGSGAFIGAVNTSRFVAKAITPPVLEDNGRLITTAKKLDPNLQPPRPDDDYLIALVSNMLNMPCYAPAAPPDNGNTGVRVPKRFFAADANPPSIIVNGTTALNAGTNIAFNAVAGGAAAAAAALDNAVVIKSLDGYQVPVGEVPIANIASTFNDPR